MKYWTVIALSAAAFAQQSSQTYIPDINGRRSEGANVSASRGAGGIEKTERLRSINGRTVPLEQVEERVIRDDASGKVVERTIRRFDPTGRPAQTERAVIEEQKRPDGSGTRRETVYRSDLNGRLEPAERSVTESRKQGSQTIHETLVERPGVAGSFRPAEKRSVVEDETSGGKRENSTVYRVSQNGDFYQALRQVREQRKSGDSTVENVANYEPDMNGSLQLASQEVKRSTKRDDGAEVTEIDLYSTAIPGRATSAGSGQQQLKEQQIVERKPSGEGFVETVSVRRPTVADPRALGAPQKISETVCKGKCQDPPAATPPKPASNPQVPSN